MRTLFLLFLILFCTSPLSAENTSIHSDLEQIQEKIWYLQRDSGKNRVSIEEQQKKLNALDSGISLERKQWNERLTSLAQENARLKDKTQQLEAALVSLGESLATLTTETRQQNNVLREQSEMIRVLETSIAALQEERKAQQSGTGQELSAFREQLAEVNAQTLETRSQLDTLGQKVSGQVKQLGYWGAGAALIFAIALAFVILLLKSRKS